MFLACGVGAFAAGVFHVFTHAFFKALLFLGAGSVIHALSGEQDLSKMGALRKKIPTTFWTMMVGALAIAGVPGLAGFFSKDEILWQTWSAQHGTYRFLWYLGFATALMTAFYMSRLFILTFLGDDRDHEKHHHAHESPFLMTGPLVLLAFLALVSGYLLNRNGLVYRLLEKPTISAPAPAAAAVAVAEAVAPAGEAHGAPVHVTEAPMAAAHHAEAGGEAEHHEGHLPHWLHLALPFLVLGSMSLAFVLYKGPRYEIADGLKTTFAPVFRLLDRRWFLDADRRPVQADIQRRCD
jgi:NADH:ubiquinone oxidoreductase subunit 5 (subunit L)/multisubunit Na+/H+ antiporter MnhA subunit